MNRLNYAFGLVMSLLLAIVTSGSLSGCDKADTLLNQIDEVIAQIDNAITVLDSRAGEFNSVLEGLPESVRENAGDLLSTEVDTQRSAFAGDAQVTIISAIDYATRRISHNLEALADGLRAERERIKAGESADGSLDAIIRRVAASVQASMPPEVISTSPNDIQLFIPLTNKVEVKKPEGDIVRFYGWGFRSRDAALTACLINDQGEVVKEFSVYDINAVSPYILSINLDLRDVDPVALEKVKVLQVFGGGRALSETPVVVKREPKPTVVTKRTPAPTVYKIRLTSLQAFVGDGKLFGATETDPTLWVKIDGGTEKEVFHGHVEKNQSASLKYDIDFKSTVEFRLIERDDPDADDTYPIFTLRADDMKSTREAVFKDGSSVHFKVVFVVR